MNFRFTIGLCAIIVGAFGLASCQPPTPRVVRVEAPTHAGVAPNDTTAQGIQVRDLDDPLSNFSKRSR